jgi:hypothetical protein
MTHNRSLRGILFRDDDVDNISNDDDDANDDDDDENDDVIDSFRQEDERGYYNEVGDHLENRLPRQQNKYSSPKQTFPTRLPVYDSEGSSQNFNVNMDEEEEEEVDMDDDDEEEEEEVDMDEEEEVDMDDDEEEVDMDEGDIHRPLSSLDVGDGTSSKSSSPGGTKISLQQEHQRQQINHLMMTPAGLQTTQDRSQQLPEINHLLMTPNTATARDFSFRSHALQSPSAATQVSNTLSYSTVTSGNGDDDDTYASGLSLKIPRSTQPPSLDSILRSSNHTRGSGSLSAGGVTIQSETTKYHSGVEREFRKEAFRKSGGANRDVEDDAASSVGSETIVEPIVVCGITCSMWFTRIANKPLNLYRISLCIVESAPCFLFCCCNKNELQGGTSSDRFILARLNTISFFFTSCQLAACLWLATVLFWVSGEGVKGTFAPHLWNVNGAVFAVGIVGGVIMITSFFTIRIINDVDLVGALRYLWFILWIFPIELFFNITLFDYHRITDVWVVHWWTAEQLSWFRKKFCAVGTAETLCVVPIEGGADYLSEDQWCEDNYNSTLCTSIRDEAQKETSFWLIIFYTSLAAWGVILMFLFLLVINTLERIISKPIVQKSRETNVPGWLTFPTVATALVGTVYLYSPSSFLRVLESQRWVGILYLATSGLFLVALLIGWFLSGFTIRSNVDKRNKGTAVVVFISVLAINTIVLAALFVSSIVWSTKVNLNQGQRGDIACMVDENIDCTNCDAVFSKNKCPEWSLEDVESIMRTQLKQSATLAAIFILYAVNVMSYGINLRKHLSMYQIDYV